MCTPTPIDLIERTPKKLQKALKNKVSQMYLSSVLLAIDNMHFLLFVFFIALNFETFNFQAMNFFLAF